MAWELLDVRAVPQYVAVALMLVLAAWLLRLDFRGRANTAFALFLIFRAFSILFGTFGNIAPSPVWDALLGYYLLAVFPALAYFVSVYPTPRGWFGKSRAGPWVLLGLGLLMEGAYLLDHCSWNCRAPGATLSHAGPLFALPLSLLLALTGLLFLLEYTRAQPGPRKQSYLLVGSVLVLNGFFDGLRELLRVSGPVERGLEPSVWSWGYAVGVSATVVPCAIAAVLVLRYWARHPEHAEARTRFLVAAAIAVGSGLGVSLVPFMRPTGGLGITIFGLWRMMIPLGIAYALVRHQLLDVDVRVKTTFRRGTATGVFAGVYFLVSETASNLTQDQYGNAAGLAAALLMTVGTDRVRRISGRFAEFFMPGVELSMDHVRQRKRELYRATFESVLEDGSISAKEEAVLARLRDKLALPPEEAKAVEVQVRRTREQAEPAEARA